MFKDSPIAHKYLDGLKGIEVGGAAHNPFHLDTINVDYTADMNTGFKKGEIELCGEAMPVDVVAEGDNLPFEDESYDFVISSHVIEHFFDPVKAIKEWHRVIKKGGYIFIICPNQYALPSEKRPVTHVSEIIARHEGKMKVSDVKMDNGHNVYVDGSDMTERGHFSVWNLEDFLPICENYKWTAVEALKNDDKVGNGFCVIIRKQ